MDKYIEPKLVGFDAKHYLNIDFSDEKYHSVIAIRVGNVLFLQMFVNIGTEQRTEIENFLREIKIKPNNDFYCSSGIRFVTSSYSSGSMGIVYYDTANNKLILRTGSTTYNSSIGFTIMLPIEEGY